MIPYVSTTCLPGNGFKKTLDVYEDADIEKVELGYCPDANRNIEKIISEYPFEFVGHNYCFPIEDEIILNLSSQDKCLREQSIDYICRAIERCHNCDINMYTFHAGFRTDPSLSLAFPSHDIPDYKTCFETFVESVRRVIDNTKQYDVEIGIENNVVTDTNTIDETPLLMFCQPGEFSMLFECIDEMNLGVLLDTGHLNVSAETLNYSKQIFVEEISEYIDAFHLHWNNAKEDAHDPIIEEDFVFELLSKFPEATVVIEGKYSDIEHLKRDIRWIKNNVC
jgi:endonuclease IV